VTRYFCRNRVFCGCFVHGSFSLFSGRFATEAPGQCRVDQGGGRKLTFRQTTSYHVWSLIPKKTAKLALLYDSDSAKSISIEICRKGQVKNSGTKRPIRQTRSAYICRGQYTLVRASHITSWRNMPGRFREASKAGLTDRGFKITSALLEFTFCSSQRRTSINRNVKSSCDDWFGSFGESDRVKVYDSRHDEVSVWILKTYHVSAESRCVVKTY
jgi:hypothetical protein